MEINWWLKSKGFDGECVTGSGGRGGVILVAAPGSLVSIIFDAWKFSGFLLLSELYIIIFISAPVWLARASACDFSVFHFLVNIVLLYFFFLYLNTTWFAGGGHCHCPTFDDLPISSENSVRFISLRIALALLSLSFAMSSK